MSINRWMDKEDVVSVYNGILLSHKKEWNNALCSNMDGPRDYKSDRERQISYDITYLWNLKYTNRNRLTDIENKFMVTKGERVWGRDKLGVWD